MSMSMPNAIPNMTTTSHSNDNSSNNTPNNSNNSNPSDILEGATPTLKVMRLQSPSLSVNNKGSLGGASILSSGIRLPDSFGVIHVGETFSAYLGALNTESHGNVTNLSVKAALQTPTTRHLLPSKLDVENHGISIGPGKHVSAIVSKTLEEVGAHVLRVEVKYSQEKSIRKYYRFNVSSPLSIRELTVRGGDDKCFVSIAIENVTANSSLMIDEADFIPPMGLVARRIGHATPPFHSVPFNSDSVPLNLNSVQQYDNSGHLPPKAMFRYLFLVTRSNHNHKSEESKLTRGIAFKDELGKAVFSWKKTMGETGQLASMSVRCPASFPYSNPNPSFIIHGSGLAIDVAKDAATSPSNYNSNSNSNSTSTAASNNPTKRSLSSILPVTVQPIDPPKHMTLAHPQTLTLEITNHSNRPKNLQLQFRMQFMSGAVICGPSFRNLGLVHEHESTTVKVRIVALVAGLFRCQGCFVVDLDSGLEVPMMSLFHLFVHKLDSTMPANSTTPTIAV